VPLHARCGQSELEALELIKRVRHPHLLGVHGYWLQDDCLIIACELADESLQSRLEQAISQGLSALPVADVLRYLEDVAEALDFLGRPIHRVNNHQVRIQHRDIKPANLLLQADAIKVADFGLARALARVIETQTVSMTPAYAPPEFFEGRVAATSDQYSLGITYYQLRTGRLPFRGSLAEVMRGHLQLDPPLDVLNSAERPIVARALAKDPLLRWAGCVKFVGELRRTIAPFEPANLISLRSPETSAATLTWRGREITSGQLVISESLDPMPLRRTKVHAILTSATAEVTVSQVFINPRDRPLDATYLCPLPGDAAVNRLDMFIGNCRIHGIVQERHNARSIYQEARRNGHRATLLEEVVPNLFSIQVTNIQPGQEVEVQITYLQSLPFESGQFQFVVPLVVLSRDMLESARTPVHLAGTLPEALARGGVPQVFLAGDSMQIDVDLNAGVPLTGYDSPSHDIEILEEPGNRRVRLRLRSDTEIPNRDFVLNYRACGESFQHAMVFEPGNEDEPGTFLWITTPPFPQYAAAFLREFTFVLDCRVAMGSQEFDLAKRAAIHLLDRLDEEDVFSIRALFDEDESAFAQTPVAAVETNLRRGRTFIEQLTPGLCSERSRAQWRTLEQSNPDGRDRTRTTVLIIGRTGHGDRPRWVRKCSDISHTRTVVLGIGNEVDRSFLNKLAAFGHGFVDFISPAQNLTKCIERALSRVSRVVLSHVELHSRGATICDVTPEPLPDLHCDQPLIVFGRYNGTIPPRLFLCGQLADRYYEAELPPSALQLHTGSVSLGALWAQRQIDRLTDALLERPHRADAIRAQVIELATRYGLCTEHTSLVAYEFPDLGGAAGLQCIEPGPTSIAIHLPFKTSETGEAESLRGLLGDLDGAFADSSDLDDSGFTLQSLGEASVAGGEGYVYEEASEPDEWLGTSLSVERQGETLIISPHFHSGMFGYAKLQVETNALRKILNDLTVRRLVIDLHALENCGAEVLSAIVSLALQTEASGGQAVLCRASPQMKELLVEIGLDRRWRLYLTREQAVRAVNSDGDDGESKQ